jgi:hypothetical protein
MGVGRAHVCGCDFQLVHSRKPDVRSIQRNTLAIAIGDFRIARFHSCRKARKHPCTQVGHAAGLWIWVDCGRGFCGVIAGAAVAHDAVLTNFAREIIATSRGTSCFKVNFFVTVEISIVAKSDLRDAFVVLYRVGEDQVAILRVVSGVRDWVRFL